MLFRAIAAILALVVGAALFSAIRAGSDDPGVGQRATSPHEKRAARIEKRLSLHPGDEKLLLATMYAWIGAGSEKLEQIDTRTDPIPRSAAEDYRAGLRAWNEYLRQTGGKAGAHVAVYAGEAFFAMVEIGSTDPEEAKADAAGSARALRIACKHQGDLYNLSNLAIHEYFNDEFAAGDRAARRAAEKAPEESVLKPREVIAQLNEYKERGEKFVARVKRGFKTLEETGEDALETPIKGYGAPSGINGYEPGTGPGSS